ncbi:MAG: T9SS type A sorting domain-containing protein [Chitinophagaceae bacterium]|nr:T9SS type A sorting domain-containing protein [Chitinophagaceae bacterium]
MKLFVSCIFLFNAIYSYGQNRTLNWLIGNDSYPLNRVGIDFSNDTAKVYDIYSPMPLFVTNASICDTAGQILFYTNGIYVANRNHEVLSNSVDFNPGWATNYYQYSGHGFSQGCLFIPYPSSDSLYWLFYVTGEQFFAHGSTQVQPLHLSCSLIDLSLDNGFGGIVAEKKNVYCIDDTVSQGRLTACKHANGRDWWIISHKFYSNIFYKLLVTPNGIYGPYQQEVGPYHTSNDFSGMATFSPDGTRYAVIRHDNFAELYDFDRCSGELSSPYILTIPDSTYPYYSHGGAFSANSRFLYADTYKKIWQYDTWATDPENSMVLVSEWDGISEPFNTWFFLGQLAPDNKIYISTFNSCYSLHIIDQPDSFGIACKVIQRGLELPDSNSNFSVPNHPNYDLGPLSGSPCDTLLISTPLTSKIEASFRIAPNPVSEWLNIIYNTKEDCLLTLYDINGRKIGYVSLFYYFKNRLLNVRNLTDGVYFAVITCNEVKLWSEKIVVQR